MNDMIRNNFKTNDWMNPMSQSQMGQTNLTSQMPMGQASTMSQMPMGQTGSMCQPQTSQMGQTGQSMGQPSQSMGQPSQSMGQGYAPPQTRVAQEPPAPAQEWQESVMPFTGAGNALDGGVTRAPQSPSGILPQSGASELPGLTAINMLNQPTAINVQSLQYLNGFLLTQIGKRVTVEFLIGSNTMTSRTGTLIGVGANYILLSEFPGNNLVSCDFYSIKFITFYYQ